MELLEIYVGEDDNERLDLYLSKKIDKISRTHIHRLIKEGLILVNGKKVKPKYLVKYKDFIEIKLPKPKKIKIIPENIPLDIIYEDEDILIINKPKGMVVHPAQGNYSKTLVNALLYHVDKLSSISGDRRPGIVHRLDKDTSGLLIVAKDNKAHKILSKQLKTRTVKRLYTALVYGELDIKEAVINAPIGRHPVERKRMTVIYKNSKEAITHYKVLEEFKGYSLIEASLETGRTHQIRVHMAYIDHPIVGDPVYSNKENEFGLDAQLLHAGELGFFHPKTGEYMEFKVEPPEYFKKIIELLRKRNR